VRGSVQARWLPAGLFALSLAYLVCNALYYYPITVDDTFICFRYAANWLAGDGLVFNPGERVEGYSDFLWVALSAGLLALGIPALVGVKVVGLASAVGLAVATWALGLRLFADRPGGAGAAALAGGLLCLNTSVAFWSQAGLETVFYALLLVTSVLRFEIEMEEDRPLPVSAALFGLAWMTRPETPIYALYFLWRRRSALARRPWGAADARWFLAASALIGPYELFGLWYYGSLLPNTHTAKVGGADLRLLSALVGGRFSQSLLARFATAQGAGFAALIAAGIAGCALGRRRLPAATWLPTLGGLVFVAYAWRDWMPRYRLFVPMLPFLFLMVACGLAEIHARLRHSRGPTLAFVVAVVLALASYANHQAFGAYRSARGTIRPGLGEARGAWILELGERVGRVALAHEDETRALLRTVPEGEVIAIGNLGLVGYLTMNPIWDVYGLVTPVVARARNDSDAAAERAMFDDLAAVRPGALLLYFPEGPRVSMDVRIDRWIRAHPEFAALYERRELAGGGQALYLRRDLSAVDEASRLTSARSRLAQTGLVQPR